jgi:HK97 family phage prohead protease
MEKRVQLYGGEVRASKSGNKMSVRGYAARYGVLSNPLPAGNGRTFRERIAKRAFDGVLATKPDVICTFNHSQDALLGRTSSGTLRLRADDQGLGFECDLPDTQAGRDTYELVQRKDVGCSFAFELGERDQNWDEEEEEIEDEKDLGLRGRVAKAIRKIAVRTIKSFRKLHDVSIVASPAYPQTSVDARNLVSAECRSYVERHTAPSVLTQATALYNKRHGTKYTEEQVQGFLDTHAAKRRKRLQDAVLD